MSLITNIKTHFYHFNTVSDTEPYIWLFYVGGILFFIASYLSQTFIDKPCYGAFAIAVRVVHHILIYFIYCSVLAPAYILPFCFLIAFITTASWILLRNKCILTVIENRLCGYPDSRVFRDLFYLSRSLDHFVKKIRIPLLIVMICVMITRLYVYYRTNRIEIQGHRGARGNRPENTLEAFAFALDNDIRTLELDLHMTKDGVLVICHNDTINSTICKKGVEGTDLAEGLEGRTGGDPSLSIRNMSLSELKQYDCGSFKNPAFPQQVLSKQTIPTFLELITLIKTKYPLLNVRMNVEIKTKETENDDYVKTFAKKLTDTLKEHGLENRCIIQSFDLRALQYVRGFNANIKTSFLVENFTEANVEEVLSVCTTHHIDIVSPDYKNLTKQIVEKFHTNHIQVLPWTVNTIDGLQHMLECRVDGIITDYPVMMKEHLAIS